MTGGGEARPGSAVIAQRRSHLGSSQGLRAGLKSGSRHCLDRFEILRSVSPNMGPFDVGSPPAGCSKPGCWVLSGNSRATS